MMDFVRALPPEQMPTVREFIRQVTAADGVCPFDEQTLLDLENPAAAAKYALIFESPAGGTAGAGVAPGAAPAADRTSTAARALAAGPEQPPALLGLAVADLRNNSMELAVHSRARRRGYGTALLALSEAIPGGTVWAHGNLPAALAFAQANGLVSARELLVLGQKIAVDAPESGTASRPKTLPAPPGWQLDTLQPADLPALVTLNARAFAAHPEQGQLNTADFEQRFSQDWFDPRLLFLLRRTQSRPESTWAQNANTEDAKLGAFAWLKPNPPQLELYVLGVDPTEQGKGLGGYLIQVALQTARQNGYAEIVLYVDGENYAAVHAYEKAQFTVWEQHTAFRLP